MSSSQQAAALATEITVAYGEGSYTIAPSEEWDLDVLEAIEDGKITHATKALLGPAQYADFRSRHRTVKELNELFEAVGKAVGSGNS